MIKNDVQIVIDKQFIISKTGFEVLFRQFTSQKKVAVMIPGM